MEYSFRRTICLGDLNDAEVLADFSADESGNVYLDAVTIGRLVLSEGQIIDMIGEAEAARQVALVRNWWIADGLTNARIDARNYWAEAAE